MNERWPNMEQSLSGSLANISLHIKSSETSMSAANANPDASSTLNDNNNNFYQPKINIVNFNNNYVEAAANTSAGNNDPKLDMTDLILNDTKATTASELQESRTEDKLNTAFSQYE
jgi:hypothetical protein